MIVLLSQLLNKDITETDPSVHIKEVSVLQSPLQDSIIELFQDTVCNLPLPKTWLLSEMAQGES